jgi:peptidase YpeB-like protein
MNDYLKLIVASVAFSAIVIAAAQDRNVSKISADQAKARFEAAGFTNVENVRREGNHWDAEATDQDGKRVSLDIDPRTGAFTQENEKKGRNEKHERT